MERDSLCIYSACCRCIVPSSPTFVFLWRYLCVCFVLSQGIQQLQGSSWQQEKLKSFTSTQQVGTKIPRPHEETPCPGRFRWCGKKGRGWRIFIRGLWWFHGQTLCAHSLQSWHEEEGLRLHRHVLRWDCQVWVLLDSGCSMCCPWWWPVCSVSVRRGWCHRPVQIVFDQQTNAGRK